MRLKLHVLQKNCMGRIINFDIFSKVCICFLLQMANLLCAYPEVVCGLLKCVQYLKC